MKHFFKLKKMMGTLGPKFSSEAKGYSDGGEIVSPEEAAKFGKALGSYDAPQEKSQDQMTDQDHLAKIKAIRDLMEKNQN